METSEIIPEIQRFVISCLKSVAIDFGQEFEVTPTSIIHGKDAPVDSISLIHFISELEQILSTELGLDLSLVDEDTFTSEESPFRDVPSLVAHIVRLADEA